MRKYNYRSKYEVNNSKNIKPENGMICVQDKSLTDILQCLLTQHYSLVPNKMNIIFVVCLLTLLLVVTTSYSGNKNYLSDRLHEDNQYISEVALDGMRKVSFNNEVATEKDENSQKSENALCLQELPTNTIENMINTYIQDIENKDYHVLDLYSDYVDFANQGVINKQRLKDIFQIYFEAADHHYSLIDNYTCNSIPDTQGLAIVEFDLKYKIIEHQRKENILYGKTNVIWTIETVGEYTHIVKQGSNDVMPPAKSPIPIIKNVY